MKLLMLAALLATCHADLLALRQRAPQSAYSAGGNDFLNGPKNSYVPPQTSYGVPQAPYQPPQNNYLPPQNNYLPPQNNYLPPPQVTPTPPNSYLPPRVPPKQPTYPPPQFPPKQPTYLPPPPPKQPTYLPPPPPKQPTYPPPTVTQYLPPPTVDKGYLPPTNNYLPPNNNYGPPSGPTTPQIPILKQINEINEDGSYKYETLTGDQTHIEQMGHIENIGTDHEEQVMHGSYSYVGPDGKTYSVTYVADANGFRAFGDHLPTPPPIPEAIRISLEQNAAEEAAQANKGNQGYPSGGPSGYPSGGPSGYPSGGPSGYPSGGPSGYPSGKPTQTYLPPNTPSYNPSSGYQY